MRFYWRSRVAEQAVTEAWGDSGSIKEEVIVGISRVLLDAGLRPRAGEAGAGPSTC